MEQKNWLKILKVVLSFIEKNPVMAIAVSSLVVSALIIIGASDAMLSNGTDFGLLLFFSLSLLVLCSNAFLILLVSQIYQDF